MRKIFTFLFAALMSISMFGRTVQEDISIYHENWSWGYNSQVTTDGDLLVTTLTGEWGAVSTGWDPSFDLSGWDKIVILVESMSGCDGEWFKLKAYLRDNTESEENQMEGLLGIDAPDNQQNYLVIDLHQEKACDLTKARILAVQCQPNGAIFKISRVYLEKEAEDLPSAPETAPAAPTRDEADVMALYCNHYATNNYNFNVQGWGSVATWQTLTIDGTNILACTDMKWEIMTNWDADSYDVSEFNNLHVDIWVPADAQAKITFEAQSGPKPSVVVELAAGWNSIDKALTEWDYDFKDMKYFIFEGYQTPAGENFEDNPFAFANVYFWKEDKRELAKVGVNFPAEDKPADNQIEMAGTFAEGTMVMEKIEATGWFISYDFVNAAEDDTFKFRSKENNDLVLCQFIPANDDEEGKWVQAIFKFGDYWTDDTWKGTPCKLIEINLSDAQFAWKEGMPEPEPEPETETAVEYTTVSEKAVKVIRDGQVMIIKNGKFFNALGAEVR